MTLAGRVGGIFVVVKVMQRSTIKQESDIKYMDMILKYQPYIQITFKPLVKKFITMNTNRPNSRG